MVLLVIAEGLTHTGSNAYEVETVKGRLLSVTIEAPWLQQLDHELRWMIPAAQLTLLVPFFFASWLIESRIAQRFLKECEHPTVRRAMFTANLMSYLLLGLFVLGLLIYNIRS